MDKTHLNHLLIVRRFYFPEEEFFDSIKKIEEIYQEIYTSSKEACPEETEKILEEATFACIQEEFLWKIKMYENRSYFFN